MKTPKELNLAQILIHENYVSAADIKKAEAYAASHHATIIDYLLREGLITNTLLGQAIAESCGVLYANLDQNPPSHEQILQIPKDVAMEYRVVLFKEDKKQVILTTDQPENKDMILKAVKPLFKSKSILLAFSLSQHIEDIFLHYREKLADRLVQIMESDEKVAPVLVDAIIEEALIYQSSDIHMEAREDEIIVRFRIDGVLREVSRITKDIYDNVLNRIKVQAGLRTDEHTAPQDGAIRYTLRNQALDLRVSIVPTLYGEKIAIRLLAAYIQGFNLSDLGLSSIDQEKMQAAAKKPFGMILVTGPTGSGKTTSLYSLIKILNRPEVNITTIEDPIEYKVIGINQIQVNEQTKLTFAQGLRTIGRQDPDIILVGEIRDKETAEISVNASLTGHLLLSTIHANDAATAIPRLLEMNIEPFLLASTLEFVVGQRLVRKICTSCRISYTQKLSGLPQADQVKNLFSSDTVTLYKGKGCHACGDTGYRGRTAIFESIEVTKEIREMILKHPTAQDIWVLARSQGARSLFEDGIEKVKNGVTTIDEVFRVAEPPVLLTQGMSNETKPKKSKTK